MFSHFKIAAGKCSQLSRHRFYASNADSYWNRRKRHFTCHWRGQPQQTRTGGSAGRAYSALPQTLLERKLTSSILRISGALCPLFGFLFSPSWRGINGKYREDLSLDRIKQRSNTTGVRSSPDIVYRLRDGWAECVSAVCNLNLKTQPMIRFWLAAARRSGR